MKRKIYRTPYGRVMMKITTAHKGRFRLVIKISLCRHLFCDWIKASNLEIEHSAHSRNIMQKKFKQFDEPTAFLFAKTVYNNLPDILKAPQ